MLTPGPKKAVYEIWKEDSSSEIGIRNRRKYRKTLSRRCF
jgi:hypothetical protein